MAEKFEVEKKNLIQLHCKKNDELLNQHQDEKITLTREMAALQEQHQSQVNAGDVKTCNFLKLYHTGVLININRLKTWYGHMKRKSC